MRLTNNTLIIALIAALVPSISAAQSTGTLAPVGQQVFLDNSGNPLNNAKICTYAAGTSTPLATYSDVSLMTANANPIRTSSAGRPTTGGIYLLPASYKFLVLTAGADNTCSTGTTIWTQDNMGAIPATAVALDVTGTAGEALSAGDAVYLSDGSGALTAGRWYKADADNTYSSSTAGMVGITPSAVASGDSGSIRIAGRVTGLSGLASGELYYAGATAGGLASTPPTNARFLAEADTTTSVIVQGNPGSVRLPDSDGTHSLVVKTTSDLTADRLFTLVPGDAARTLTLSGNPTIDDWFDQSVKIAASPTFADISFSGGDLIATANAVFRRNTSDASDNGTVQVAGGGAAGSTRGSDILVNGNEATLTGDVLVTLGDVSGAQFRVSNGGDVLSIEESDGSLLSLSSKQTRSQALRGSNSTDSGSTIVTNVDTAVVATGTQAMFLEFTAASQVTRVGSVSINNNAVAYNTTSDARLKVDLGPTRWGLDALRQIKVRDYYFSADEGHQRRQGFFAQELNQIYPEAVSVGGDDPALSPWSVEYGRLTPLLVQSSQELDDRLSKQLDLIAGIEARLKALEAENAALKARLEGR